MISLLGMGSPEFLKADVIVIGMLLSPPPEEQAASKASKNSRCLKSLNSLHEVRVCQLLASIAIMTVLMNMPGELRFTAKGVWTHDGVEVKHKGVAKYFSRHLRWSEEGYLIEVSGKAVKVVVEDSPFVVTTIENLNKVFVNDGSCQSFEPGKLSAVGDERLYLPVREGQFWARLSKPAVQALESGIGYSGGFYFELKGRKYPISSLDPAGVNTPCN